MWELFEKKNIKYCVGIVNLVSWCLRKYFEALNYSYFIFMLHLEEIWLQFYTSILNYLHFFTLWYFKDERVEENLLMLNWFRFIYLFFLIFILFCILKKSSCQFIRASFTYISTISLFGLFSFEKWIIFCILLSRRK